MIYNAILLATLNMLNLLDFMTTYIGIEIMHLAYEQNVFMSWLISSVGWHWTLVIKISALIFTYLFIYQVSCKKKMMDIFKVSSLVACVMSAFVVGMNTSVILLGGYL